MSLTGQVQARSGQARVTVSMHSHREALLVVGLRGAATIGTGDRDWEVAPHSILWVAGGAPHRLQTSADHHSLILSFAPNMVSRPSGWVEARGFVHDLVERVGRAPDSERRDRLTAVLVDELSEPAPASARLGRVNELVTQVPALSVVAIARDVGMSERTFRRWFSTEVGTSFTRWRQARIVERAILRLQRGESVKCVAAELGYDSASAFTAMFKRVTNDSPQRHSRPR